MPGIASLFQNQEETDKPVNALIEGSIPNWINGQYLRVGPGKFDIGPVSMNHFIDGYAMLSKFEIKDGEVKFNKKYLQTTAYKKAVEHKQPFFPEFATKGNIATTKSIFSRVASTFSSADITDNCSINLYTIGNELFASSEACHAHGINPEKMESCDKIDYYKIFGVHMATAHPVQDKRTGDWYNIGTSFTTGAKYQICKIPGTSAGVKDAIKKAAVVGTIYPSWTTYFAYFHSFAMTDNYIVLVEQPLIMSVVKMTDAKLKGKSIRDIMEWTPSEKNRFHIFDKRTSSLLKTKYISDESFFFFHLINSYEEDGHIVIDIDAYPSNEVMDKMSIGRLRKGDLDQKDPSRIQRFVLPIISNVKNETIGDNLVRIKYTSAGARRDGDSIILYSEGIGHPGFEAPVINPHRRGQNYQFVYGSGSMLPGFYENALCKIDITTGETKLWRDSSYIYAGEPCFVPIPGKTEKEDAGILITTCSNTCENGRDYLVFVDASTMEEIGRAWLTVQIPQSLHGIFMPFNTCAK